MKLFCLINAPSNSGRTECRLCFEKYFSKDASEEEIDKWVEKLQSFSTPYYYHHPPVGRLSKSFKTIEYGDLCGMGSYTIYKFADEHTLYIDIHGVWNESFELKNGAEYFETHEDSGRYRRIFTTLDNVEWLNIGTIGRPRYVNSEDILKGINI